MRAQPSGPKTQEHIFSRIVLEIFLRSGGDLGCGMAIERFEMLKSALISFFKESQKMQKLLFWDFGNLDGKLTLKKKNRVLKFELHAIPKF